MWVQLPLQVIRLILPGIYPFPDADPFVLHHRPDIYIVGNQPAFETAIVGGKLGTSPLTVNAD
jgi:DNA polymerase II small subunit/DNA polymerase delta subunit B